MGLPPSIGGMVTKIQPEDGYFKSRLHVKNNNINEWYTVKSILAPDELPCKIGDWIYAYACKVPGDVWAAETIVVAKEYPCQ